MEHASLVGERVVVQRVGAVAEEAIGHRVEIVTAESAGTPAREGRRPAERRVRSRIEIKPGIVSVEVVLHGPGHEQARSPGRTLPSAHSRPRVAGGEDVQDVLGSPDLGDVVDVTGVPTPSRPVRATPAVASNLRFVA